MSATSGRPIASRREVLILLPIALLLLVFISSYILLAYRSTVRLLIEDRQTEAEAMARQLRAEIVTRELLPDADWLRQRLPGADNVVILDRGDRPLVSAVPVVRMTEPSPRLPWRTGGDDVVTGSARFKRGVETLTVRVDLPASILRGRERSLAILAPLLLVVNGALTLLVLIFLRRFLAPFDELVARARGAGRSPPAAQDEAEFLVETFEKALEALAQPPQVDELKVLEGALTRSLESGVLLYDRDGTLLSLNPLAASLLELDDERIGMALDAALAPHRRLAEILERAVRRERAVQRTECVIETSSGERTLGLTVHPLRRDDGAVRGFLVIFADLTEIRKRSQERRLVDSLSQLGELTAGIAHELRNSLATLRGYLSLIDRDPDQESIADYLVEIRRESDHLQRVLEDFLSFARPGSARPEEVDLLPLLHRAASDPALGEATVTVGKDAEDADRYGVWGDPQLLERAVRNVLSNAAEAQRETACREPVRARLRTARGGVEIVIEDQGAGLDEEAREKLFDPFYTRRAGGVGMGLALTRRILLLHAGRVTLENRASGGTRAVLWIPVGRSVTEGSDRSREPTRDQTNADPASR